VSTNQLKISSRLLVGAIINVVRHFYFLL
jgi:hypothetical protein